MCIEDIDVTDVMIEREDLITANPQDKVAAVILRMIRENIGGMPIVEKEKCVGIVTMRDIMFANFYGAGELSISEIMTKDLITVSPNDDMSKVIDLMLENKVERIPVVKNGKLKGLIVRNGILKSLK
ncbi:hypothetical protein C9439_02430 [archaeon SCG-AAA382B04]|nr:hypothetical protein C9439_02430 [archaeon SCG-AAA382B04]